eukprot:TRINITY_DN14404_c0_g1_i2.p1 TRINITY_DN14404_c0_g1~~TRINITY_DN14404_c0_g1_i2.p1  ORF type:complete len:903 (+),score=244.76 TRINITY_DN14404_c0_g1_i2:206-2710(+)
MLSIMRGSFRKVSGDCRAALRVLDDIRREPTCEDANAIHAVSSPMHSEVQENAFRKLMASYHGCTDSSVGGPARPLAPVVDHQGMLLISMYGCLRPRRDPVREGHLVEKYFRERYCELQGQFLYYYTDQHEKPTGLIDLSMCELLDPERPARLAGGGRQARLPSPGPFSFILRREQSLPYYFVAQGDYDKEQWFARLRQACNRFSFVRSDIPVGQRIRVWVRALGSHHTGVCRWVGGVAPEDRGGEASGEDEGEGGMWVGAELDRAVSCGHEGSPGGHHYFTCPKGRGVLVPAHQVSLSLTLDVRIEDGEPLPSSYNSPADFEFIAVIGRGAFGRVCKVRDRRSGEVYACKVLQKAALVKESEQRCVRREKTLLLNIRHPFIVKLHAVFQDSGRLFLLFNFLSGGELFYHLCHHSKQGGFPEDQARFYISEISLAISHLHSKKIIHRDLKAQNLVLDSDGHVMLTDFGFAKTIDPGERNTTMCGTPPYMAPEMLYQTAEGYSYEVDWWSLGVLLFLMLTGHYPFWHRNAADMKDQILNRTISVHRFPQCEPPLSVDSRDCCSKLLRKSPDQRLADIETFGKHSWFTDFDWGKCSRRELEPPFVPDKLGKNTKYFREQRTLYGTAHWTGSQTGIHAKPRDEHEVHKSSSGSNPFVSFYDVHLDYKAAGRRAQVPHLPDAEGRRAASCCGEGSPVRGCIPLPSVARSLPAAGPGLGDLTSPAAPVSFPWHRVIDDMRRPSDGCTADADVEFLHGLNDRDVGDSPFASPPQQAGASPAVQISPMPGPVAEDPCRSPTSPALRLPPQLEAARDDAPSRPTARIGGFRLWVADRVPCLL